MIDAGLKVLGMVFDFFAPAPKLTPAQAERAVLVAEEKQQEAADLAAYFDNEAARDRILDGIRIRQDRLARCAAAKCQRVVRSHPLQPAERQACGAIVIIMQRLHEDDLVGHVLGQEPWEVVRFPAIAEADEGARDRNDLGTAILHAPPR